MIDLKTLLLIGGGLHFAILIASALVPRVLDWRNELRKLPQLLAQLIWVHGAFIVLTIIGFGALSAINSAELASGTMLARSVCGFIALFWGTRLGVQFFYFNANEYLTTWTLKIGYHGLTVVFAYLTAVYAWSALAK
ncbi:MAG TPA: hypothetical protein VGH74_14720 [Planctomycetaceae bacterium]